jgi:hypothetical protein
LVTAPGGIPGRGDTGGVTVEAKRRVAVIKDVVDDVVHVKVLRDVHGRVQVKDVVARQLWILV